MATKRKNPAAVQMGRKGGKKSRSYMTKKEATELARKAVNARWAKVKKQQKKGK